MTSPEYPREVMARLRELPAVDEVASRLPSDFPHASRVDAARAVIDDARVQIAAGRVLSPADIVRRARKRLLAAQLRTMRQVINATGVLIHTNLGRVPLGERQLRAINAVAGEYTNLEYDLDRGERGSRYDHSAALLARLTGAEDALVVNNNAAAVLLVLSSLCRDRDVVISRGELIEIGGEFRIPDVMASSGAGLVEIGTTNRTHLGDYERAISTETAAFMKVHTSNYKIVGFASSVTLKEVAKLARGRGVLVLEDLGSGLIALDDAVEWIGREPPVRRSIESGVDVVTFSGDKLLGGPQAGLIAGRRELITRIKKNPLLRAVRVDKLTLAALDATLESYERGDWQQLPFWRMALADAGGIEARAKRIVAEVAEQIADDAKLEVVPAVSVPGGGSLPGEGIGSWAISIDHPERSAADLHAELRRGEFPLVGRIEDDRLLLDLRTVDPASDPTVGLLLVRALT